MAAGWAPALRRAWLRWRAGCRRVAGCRLQAAGGRLQAAERAHLVRETLLHAPLLAHALVPHLLVRVRVRVGVGVRVRVRVRG